MNEVPMTKTPVTAADAKAAVAAAFRDSMGRPATDKELPLLMALVWLETGRGKSVQNYNLGNISANEETYSGDAWRPPWYPEPGPDTSARNVKLHQDMLDGKAPKAFRAYDTLQAGAEDFTNQLKKSFPEVIDAAGTGDATEFRDALAQKYSKDYKNTPPATFESLAKEFGATDEQVKPAPTPAPAPKTQSRFFRKLLIGGAVLALGYGIKQTFFPAKKPSKPVPADAADGVLRPVGSSGGGTGEPSNG